MTGKSSKSLSAQSRRMTITAPVKSKCANEQAQNRGSRTHVRYSMIHAKTCHSSSKHSIISIRCQVPSVSKHRSSKNIPIFCTCDHLQFFFSKPASRPNGRSTEPFDQRIVHDLGNRSKCCPRLWSWQKSHCLASADDENHEKEMATPVAILIEMVKIDEVETHV